MEMMRLEQEVAVASVGDVDAEVIARTRYQGFDNRQIEETAIWVDDACEWLDVPTGTVLHGPSGYLRFDYGWIRAFPDARWQVNSMVASADLIATEFIASGTHLGSLGVAGGHTIDATGKRVELRCLEVLQIHGAQIVRARSYYDSLSLLRQLGVI
jgi:predicted ester cyclase